MIASSRFTIPVSIILPLDGREASDAVIGAVEHLLGLTYPEHEVIVVAAAASGLPPELRERFDLKACEIFFRRSIQTRPVRALYRSGADARLLVVDCETEATGDALNCGLNLARYRYVCCADARARYVAGSLLTSMQPAVEDPAIVIAVTTNLAAGRSQDARSESVVADTRQHLQRVAGFRELLGRGGRSRLRLAMAGLQGFTLWRRDVVLEIGGFASNSSAGEADLTLRAHRHLLRSKQRYRIVHIGEPVGTAWDDRALASLLEEQAHRSEATARAVWRSRGMLLNPAYGRLGMIDLPQLLLTSIVVPWFELLSLIALPLAPLAGVLTVRQLMASVLAIAFGNGLLIGTAMLRSPMESDPQRVLALYCSRPWKCSWRVRRGSGPA